MAWSNIDLADGNAHYIEWTRDWYGDMETDSLMAKP